MLEAQENPPIVSFHGLIFRIEKLSKRLAAFKHSAAQRVPEVSPIQSSLPRARSIHDGRNVGALYPMKARSLGFSGRDSNALRLLRTAVTKQCSKHLGAYDCMPRLLNARWPSIFMEPGTLTKPCRRFTMSNLSRKLRHFHRHVRRGCLRSRAAWLIARKREPRTPGRDRRHRCTTTLLEAY